MVARLVAADNRRTLADPHASLLDELRSLIEALPPRGSAARLEHLLTDGYAHVLTLETERTRLRRQIGELAVREVPGDPADQLGELNRLSERLAGAEDELECLRAVLAALRPRVSQLHAAALSS